MRGSVIIPVFNSADDLKKMIPKFAKEYKNKDFEIILVNDGSTDESDTVCKKLEKKFRNIRYLSQENKGVSAARNLGIRHAEGKYIFFLDSDDELEKQALTKLADFFDTVYDEVDLITYPIETHYKGRILEPHFRYRFLTYTGVYDLREYPYIGQTTMNIVVKNRYEENILFDEKQSFSEDQRYCCDVVADKLKMGYYHHTKYIYYRSENSASGKMAGSCFIFEQCMQFFEDLFARYEEVPAAFQGLYVNDLYWKLCSNILLPYHYDEDQYREAWGRIERLLRRCQKDIILQHPNMNFFEKYFWVRKLDPHGLQCKTYEESFCLYDGERLILEEHSPEFVMTKVSVTGNLVRVAGFVKTVFCQFYDGEPTVCVEENDGELTRKLKLRPSKHNYYLAREETQRFWAVDYEADITKVRNARFEVEFGNRWYPIHYYFMPQLPFTHKYERYEYEKGGLKICLDGDKRMHFFTDEQKAKAWEEKKQIWLYYDCKGVACDNGMLQYQHDIAMKDGVERYYVLSDEKQRKHLPENSNVVSFGSDSHKELFLKADKIITAYVEDNNVIPYKTKELPDVSAEFRFETIYLQHGVLHIEMPWKYSPEKIIADKVVVSTKQEKYLWLQGGFREKDLWECKMPRFDLLNPGDKKVSRKILYAPSWREYLVQNSSDGWKLLESKFLASTYFKKIRDFLTDPKLHDLLQQYDYELEVKLHPIFFMCEKYFNLKSDRIRLTDVVAEEGEYDLFITDFSSWLYDYVYLQTEILSFIPDRDEFLCGMNSYRRLNPLETDWSMVITEGDELVQRIQRFITERKGMEFHADFYDVENARDSIYQKIINES